MKLDQGQREKKLDFILLSRFYFISWELVSFAHDTMQILDSQKESRFLVV